jgi:hypothetical protein
MNETAIADLAVRMVDAMQRYTALSNVARSRGYYRKGATIPPDLSKEINEASQAWGALQDELIALVKKEKGEANESKKRRRRERNRAD